MEGEVEEHVDGLVLDQVVGFVHNQRLAVEVDEGRYHDERVQVKLLVRGLDGALVAEAVGVVGRVDGEQEHRGEEEDIGQQDGEEEGKVLGAGNG